MAIPIYWSNVGLDIQTSLTTLQAISAITKANPAVCTYTGADIVVNGDFIIVTAAGMSQVNDRVFRVANVNTATNAFDLEGEDSTLYDTFVATGSSFQTITFGASANMVQTINVSGGEPEFADVTTIHDFVRKRAPTVLSPLSFAMDNLFDLTDPFYVEGNKAYKAKKTRAIRLRFGTGYKMVLTGYVSASGVPTGQAQGVVQMKMSIEAQNVPTSYST